MREKTWALEEQGAKVGLKINATKTRFMRFGTKRCEVVLISGERIKEVGEFTYLEIIVNKKGGRPCTHWEGEAGIFDGETNMAVYGTNNQDKVESLWVECEGVLLYGSETWRLAKEVKLKFQVFVSKSLTGTLRI